MHHQCAALVLFVEWILDVIASLIFFHGNSKNNAAGTAPEKTNLGVFLEDCIVHIRHTSSGPYKTAITTMQTCLVPGGFPLGDTHTHTQIPLTFSTHDTLM